MSEIIRADHHCHISKEYFADPLAEINALSQDSGLEFICLMGVNYENDCENLTYKRNFEGSFLKIGLGLHPSDVIELGEYSPEEYERIEALIRENTDAIDYIGEIGIDFTYPHSDEFRTQQIDIFKRFCVLAKELGKPVSVHARAAMAEVMEVVGEVFEPATFNGFLHCFTGSYDEAQFMINHGLKLGIGGIITFKKTENLRETVRKILHTYPGRTFNDLCGLETDTPYLSPEPNRSEQNNPRKINIIADFVEAQIIVN